MSKVHLSYNLFVLNAFGVAHNVFGQTLILIPSPEI